MMSPPAGFARPTGHPATRATQARERGARPGSPANRARAWPRLEIVRSESAEESPQLHRQLARLATPGDDDARMPPTGLEPLAVEAFAVGPVERHEDLVCIAGNVELRLTAGVSYAPWSPARVWLVAAALTPTGGRRRAALPGRAPRTWPTSQWGAGAGTEPPGRSRSRRLLPDRGRLRVRHRRLSTLRAQGPPALVGAALGSFAAAGTNPVNRSSV